MSVSAAPSSNLIWGGYRPRRVLSGSGRRSGKVFGIGARDSVASARRAGLDRVKGKALQPRRIDIMEMAVFCGFRTVAMVSVTIGIVTIGPKWRISVTCRLIADYAAAPICARAVGPAGALESAHARGGASPFRLADRSTPVARIAAGLREKSMPPMVVSTVRTKSVAGHGVGGRGAPALAGTGRNQAEKPGPGARASRARTLVARRRGGAFDHAGVALVQGGARPFGVKGAATLCAPGLRVN